MSAIESSSDIDSLLNEHLADPSSSFSIGSFGAVAEFFRDRTEIIEARSTLPPYTIVTGRGAMQLRPRRGILPCAYETLSTRKNAWLHGVALCLESAAALGANRGQLTELGPDVDAIRSGDRSMALFDLGLGLANADFCVRTGDAGLVDILRSCAGSNLLGESSHIFDTIIAHSPHRVVTSQIGRIEVFQPIDRLVTPEGPHTHVLPKLLRGGRTHDARIPIPKAYLPCLNIYPAIPRFDENSDAGSDGRRHNFEAALEKWGHPAYVGQKKRVRDMLDAGADPLELQVPATRLERTALRISLRQYAFDQGLSDRVLLWRARFDP